MWLENNMDEQGARPYRQKLVHVTRYGRIVWSVAEHVRNHVFLISVLIFWTLTQSFCGFS